MSFSSAIWGWIELVGVSGVIGGGIGIIELDWGFSGNVPTLFINIGKLWACFAGNTCLGELKQMKSNEIACHES
jgi:hypothetical protein